MPVAGAGADSEVDGEQGWWSCGLVGEGSLRDFYCVEGALIHHHIYTIRLPGAWHTLTSLVYRSLPLQLMLLNRANTLGGVCGVHRSHVAIK